MSAEVSDQVVKMMLSGVEVSVKIAGKATKHLIAFLLALKSGDKKISGKTNIAKILTQSKNIRIFTVKDEDLETFKGLAKKYGILYSVIKDKNLGDGIKDVMVKGEDASKLQRVFDILGYGDVDRNEPSIVDDDKKKQASRQEPESQRFRRDHANIDMEQVVKDFRAGNRDAMTPENWKAYLALNSQFYAYSEKNKDLIFEQNPAATSVLSKTRWGELGRYPKAEAAGIKIVMPELINGEKTGSFVDAKVYDISETYGDDNVSDKFAVRLEEGSKAMKSEINRLQKSSPVPVEIKNNLETKCLYDPDQKKILMRGDLSGSDTYKGLCRETVQARAHQKLGENYARDNVRLTADSVAYSMAYKYGIDTSDFSFDYMGGEIDRLSETALHDVISPITAEASKQINIAEKAIPKDALDIHADKVSFEPSPTNKTELAERMQGKNISDRKSLAEGFIQSRDSVPKGKSKTILHGK